MSLRFANGDPTGYGYHADFFNGWQSGVLQKAIDVCNCNPYGDPTCCVAAGAFTMNQKEDCYISRTVDEQGQLHMIILSPLQADVGTQCSEIFRFFLARTPFRPLATRVMRPITPPRFSIRFTSQVPLLIRLGESSSPPRLLTSLNQPKGPASGRVPVKD